MTKILLIVFSLLFSPYIYAETESAEQIVKNRCSACHSVSIVYKARKTKDEWTMTIERMISYGLRLNEKEKEEVIEYLKDLKRIGLK